MMIGAVERDRRNGSIHSRYHGYMTGAHKSVAAIGQANSAADNSADFFLIQIVVSNPTSTANPTTTCALATRSNVANTGSLNRKLRT